MTNAPHPFGFGSIFFCRYSHVGLCELAIFLHARNSWNGAFSNTSSFFSFLLLRLRDTRTSHSLLLFVLRSTPFLLLYFSPMALLLCNIHLNHPIFKTHHKRHRFNTNTNIKLRVSLSLSNPSSSTPRRVLLPPLKSASINGFSVQNAPEFSRDHQDVELSEKLRRFIGFVRTLLPGGNWWNFSDDVEVRILAKPVTVLRALIRMWHLVAQDRWVIFAAFSALILAAVRASLRFCKLFTLGLELNYNCVTFCCGGSAFGNFNTTLLDRVNLYGTESWNRGVPSECASLGYSMYHFRNMQVKILYGQSTFLP